MNTPSVSILLSIYKEPVVDIQVAINSVLVQTMTDFELLVAVDWPENTPAITYLEKLAQQDQRVRFFVNETNLGLGASLNKLIAHATGRYSARMDTADTVPPEKLAKQLTYLQAHPDVDLLFTQWQEQFPDGSIVEKKPTAAAVRNIQKTFFTESNLLHASMMVKTDILKQHPYPAMERPEDFALFLTLIRLGYKFDLLEEILYTYQIDPSQKYQKVRVYSKNLCSVLFTNIRYYWRNGYFWLYYFRAVMEFLISRNETIYTTTHKVAATIWKRIFS